MFHDELLRVFLADIDGLEEYTVGIGLSSL